MRNLYRTLLFIVFFSGISAHIEAQFRVVMDTTIVDTLFNKPESVSYDDTDGSYYVSNVGNGRICVMDSNKQVSIFFQDSASFLGIKVDKIYIYVAQNYPTGHDDRIVVIDKKTAEISWHLSIPNSKQLNDIELDQKGNLYVSDRGGNKVYKVDLSTRVHTLLCDSIQTPNGLLYERSGDELWVCNTLAKSSLYLISARDGSLVKVYKTDRSNLDGLSKTSYGDLLLSSWSEDWKSSKLLLFHDEQFRSIHSNSNGMADIENKTGKIAIANFYKNSVSILRIY